MHADAETAPYTASTHCLHSLPPLTASTHCLHSLPPLTASTHCLHSLPPLADRRSYRFRSHRRCAGSCDEHVIAEPAVTLSSGMRKRLQQNRTVETAVNLAFLRDRLMIAEDGAQRARRLARISHTNGRRRWGRPGWPRTTPSALPARSWNRHAAGCAPAASGGESAPPHDRLLQRPWPQCRRSGAAAWPPAGAGRGRRRAADSGSSP